jgi:hypothetical protein
MIPELNNEERIFFNLIDKTVFFIYSSRPIAGEGMPKRFRFSLPFIRCSANIFDEIIYSFENALICPLPKDVVFPGMS